MEKLQKAIIEISLERELDLVIAYKKAMQLAEISGLTFTDQTKFATAVSEVSRNALAYAHSGEVILYISKEATSFLLEAVITDQGPGIDNLVTLKQRINTQSNTKPTGLQNCKRLAHKLNIASEKGKGTTVKISMYLPANHPPINNLILSGWRTYFSEAAPISPYDEIKRQNHLLLRTLEDLKVKESQTKEQLKEIQCLNNELENNYIKIKELSKQKAAQNELLIKRNKELDEFAHIVSHDMKAPVQNLKSLAELIQSGKMIDQDKILTIFSRQVNKMENLIDSILAYSMAGHENVAKTNVDLKELIGEVAQSISKPENYNIQLHEEFPPLFTEEVFIYQVFHNLISNAIKYNDKEEGKVRVGFSQNGNGTSYYFVEDNGPGIPKDKRELVFNMFTILHKVKNVDSTGIGLAIVKKMILERGGDIWIEDSRAYESGARFCFTWPDDLLH